jgi:hypothetical protein
MSGNPSPAINWGEKRWKYKLCWLSCIDLPEINGINPYNSHEGPMDSSNIFVQYELLILNIIIQISYETFDTYIVAPNFKKLNEGCEPKLNKFLSVLPSTI